MFPIKTETVLDEKEMLAAGKEFTKATSKGTTDLLGILTLVMAPALVVIALTDGEDVGLNVFMAGVTAVLGLFFLVGLPLLQKDFVKKQIKSAGERKATVEFYEDRIVAAEESGQVSGTDTFAYSALVMVVESSERFMVCAVSARTCFIVPKNGLTAEQIAAIRSLLSAAVPQKKYKVVK